MNQPISKNKKVLFFSTLIALPVLLLLIVEIFLRLVNYGGDLKLVLTREINETTYCYINKKVAKRFFSQPNIHIPDARTAVFKKEKSPNTCRIFCLGGSTTAGFPFQFNATFPSLLKDRLDVLFPRKKIEVVNVGISAINSFSVLEFTKELVNYEPDLFLIYMGHNEFYGALGVGSTQQFGQSRNWILFYLQLQQFRFFNLLRDAVGSVQQLFQREPAGAGENHTLMEQVVGDRYIYLNSAKYKQAQEYFSQNLTEIIRLAQNSGAKVITSTLVSNLADQEPFHYQLAERLTKVQKERWHLYMDQGCELEKNGEPNKALVQYHKAEKIDPRPATIYFRRAKCLQITGNAAIARKEYRRAKDFDLLRFRASSDFSTVIREISRRENVPVIDLEAVFSPYCRDEILDNMLFTDHLHPSFPGYFWMAKAFCQSMGENGYIVPSKQWEWGRGKTTAEYRRLAGVTDLDLEIASQRIRKLTAGWPFKQETILRKNSGSEYDQLIEKTVQLLFERKIGWNEAHYRIARFRQKNKNYDLAAREYEAVIKVTPFNYFPFIELANLHLRQKKYGSAEKTLQQGLNYSRHLPFIYAKLGMLYFFMKRLKEAEKQLLQAIQINTRTNLFNPDELAGAHYLLSMTYGESGKIKLAKQAAKTALDIKPGYKEALAVLSKLQAMEN